MTAQERDYEAVLSRVLRTTTDQFEPVGDGLTKIRARLSEPWLKRQWWLLRSELMVFRWLVVVRCESFCDKFKSRSGTTDLIPGTAQQADGGLRSLLSLSTLAVGNRQQRSAGPAMTWLRPALAVAAAVVLVVAGALTLSPIRTVVGLTNSTGNAATNPGQQAGNGTPYGGGTQMSGPGGVSGGRSRAPSAGAAAARHETSSSPTPCAPASPLPDSSPSPTTTSPSPSPSPTTTSPSPSPSPTTGSPSPTDSNGPLTGGIPSQTQEAISTTALVACGQTPGPQPSPSGQATATP